MAWQNHGMRVAALYDIHGNLPALEAVLDEIACDPVDLVIVGGDVMPGPMPRESLERLQSLGVPARFIRGNGDRDATPRNDEDVVTRLMSDDVLRPLFDGAADVVVCGHTHMQFDRAVGAARVVNAGSVGMPFEQPAGAYWLRLGPGVELRRTAYDLAAAAAAVRHTAYPGADEFARVNVLEPPDMLEAFTQYGLAQIGGAAGGA